jgi:enoyl-CoA hydratase
MAALLVKESVNQTQDNQGFYNALNACFTMHELNHAHWAIVHDDGMAVAKLGEDVADWRGTKLKPSQRDTVEAPVEA